MFSRETPDEDDFFKDTRMSFGDHIEELRYHLIRAILGLIVGIAISFAFGHWVLHLITKPVEDQLMVFYKHRVEKKAEELQRKDPAATELDEPKEMPFLVRASEFKSFLQKLGVAFAKDAPAGDSENDLIDFPILGKPLGIAIAMHDAERVIGKPPLLSTLNVMEAFMVYFKVCAVTGLVISSPWVFWQIWAFIAAGPSPITASFTCVQCVSSSFNRSGSFIL